MMQNLLLAALLVSALPGNSRTTVTQQPWGETDDGASVTLYTLENNSLRVTLTSFGAHIVGIDAPDRSGNLAGVALGYDSLAGYEADTATYIGGTIGRFGNRIAKGQFTIDGHSYQIPINNAPNALHGGPDGFDRRVWTGRPVVGGVEFTLVSPDGDMGFPGELSARITYTLVGSSLRMEYHATTTKPTVVNMTNHAYFNLAGVGGSSVLNYVLTIDADHYTPVDSGLIPTGKVAPVDGTPFDFRKPTPIGSRIGATNEQLHLGHGYDHNFVLSSTVSLDGLRRAAFVMDPYSGRTLTVTTTEPAVQLYTGNFLNGKFTGHNGDRYLFRSGFCLETQHYPDAPNHPNFPSTLLRPGDAYHSVTVYTFGVDNPATTDSDKPQDTPTGNQ